MAEDQQLSSLKGKLQIQQTAEFFASSPDVGEGVAGMRIARDSEYGILAVYRASDTYNFEDGTGTAALLIKTNGDVVLTDASLELTGVGHIALGSPPPTSATAGTGIWIDDTGVYGLASGVQQAYLRAADGRIGGGQNRFLIDNRGVFFGGGISGPNNPGTLANDAGIGNVAWSNPLNAGASDNAYATVTLAPFAGFDVSYYLKATNFGFSLPSTATIVGVVVQVKWKQSQADTYTLHVKLVKGGSVVGTENTISRGSDTGEYVDYFGAPDSLWGTTLTYSDVNSSNFGCVVWLTDPLTGATVSVDSIQIVIYYRTLSQTDLAFFNNNNIVGVNTLSVASIRVKDGLVGTKSLLVTVDNNFARFEEAGSAADNLLRLDLANARVAINDSSATTLASALSVNREGTGNTGVLAVSNYNTTNGNTADLEFVSKDSGGAREAFALLRTVLLDHTNGSEASDLRFFTRNAGVNTERFRADASGINLAAGHVLRVNDTQVVTSRRTGWGAPTGTATRTTFATSTVTLPQLAERVKALIDDLTTHGLIGA